MRKIFINFTVLAMICMACTSGFAHNNQNKHNGVNIPENVDSVTANVAATDAAAANIAAANAAAVNAAAVDVTAADSDGAVLATTKDKKEVRVWDYKMDDETGDVSYIISFDYAKAGELWSWCRMWLAENVKEYNRIKQIEDKQEGRLVVSFVAPVSLRANDGKWESRWVGTQTWKMTIQCKDERFRVRMTEYNSKWDAQPLIMGRWGQPLEQVNNSKSEASSRMGAEIFAKQYKKAISDIIASQANYLKKMSEEDDDF